MQHNPAQVPSMMHYGGVMGGAGTLGASAYYYYTTQRDLAKVSSTLQFMRKPDEITLMYSTQSILHDRQLSFEPIRHVLAEYVKHVQQNRVKDIVVRAALDGEDATKKMPFLWFKPQNTTDILEKYSIPPSIGYEELQKVLVRARFTGAFLDFMHCPLRSVKDVEALFSSLQDLDTNLRNKKYQPLLNDARTLKNFMKDLFKLRVKNAILSNKVKADEAFDHEMDDDPSLRDEILSDRDVAAFLQRHAQIQLHQDIMQILGNPKLPKEKITQELQEILASHQQLDDPTKLALTNVSSMLTQDAVVHAPEPPALPAKLLDIMNRQLQSTQDIVSLYNSINSPEPQQTPPMDASELRSFMVELFKLRVKDAILSGKIMFDANFVEEMKQKNSLYNEIISEPIFATFLRTHVRDQLRQEVMRILGIPNLPKEELIQYLQAFVASKQKSLDESTKLALQNVQNMLKENAPSDEQLKTLEMHQDATELLQHKNIDQNYITSFRDRWKQHDSQDKERLLKIMQQKLDRSQNLRQLRNAIKLINDAKMQNPGSMQKLVRFIEDKNNDPDCIKAVRRTLELLQAEKNREIED